MLPSMAPKAATKRVRFDLEDDVPVSRTPSPTFSDDSAPPSPILRTPPTYASSPKVHHSSSPYLSASTNYGRIRGHSRTPSPLSLPGPAGALHIHQILAKDIHSTLNVAPFVWDVTLDPSTIRARHPHDPKSAMMYALAPEVLAQPATYPPLPKVTLKCEQFPWVVVVGTDPSASNPMPPPVTVGDLLSQLYHNLRLPVQQKEFDAVCSKNREFQNGIERAYKTRCGRIVDAREGEEQRRRGVRRVDMLMNVHLFAGLATCDKTGELLFYVSS